MSYAQWFDGSIRRTERVLRNYGLGLLFAANIFGAGSIYILSNTGAEFGFTLLWVLPVALFVGLAMHEMSARLAVIDEPLMVYIRELVGPTAAKSLAVFVAFIMHFWSVANYALTGAILTALTPLENLYVATAVSAVAGLALVEFRLYRRVETVIAGLVLAVFGSYLAIFFGLDLPLGDVARGFVPEVQTEIGYLTMIISLLGTTVYYPNFFIQTSMQSEKNWDDVNRYRRDHTVGLVAVILLSIAVLAIAAVAVPSGELSVTDPAKPLVDAVGAWALVVFLVGAGAASFSSATGTLFGAGFMIPQAFGYESVFGDWRFRVVVEGLIVLSVAIAMSVLAFTDFTPVRLAILMPAVNGVVGLPLTATALYMATKRYFDPSRSEKTIFATVVLLMFVVAAVTIESLIELLAALA